MEVMSRVCCSNAKAVTVLFYVIVTLKICYSQNTRVQLTKLKQDVNTLRNLAIVLRHDVDDLYFWKNNTFADLSEHDLKELATEFHVGSTDDNDETLELNAVASISLKREIGEMVKQVQYVVNGLQGQKSFVREQVFGISTEVRQNVSNILDKVDNSLMELDNKISSVSRLEKEARNADLAMITERLDTMETRIATNNAQLKRTGCQCENELDETKKSVTQINERLGQLTTPTKDNDEIREQLKHVTNQLLVVSLKQDGWIMFRDSFYKLFKTEVHFQTAVNECEENGAYLVEIDDNEENRFIKYNFKRESYWIGATDERWEGHFWTPMGQKQMYTFWYRGEPNNADWNEDCVGAVATTDNRWNDFPCTHNLQYICEQKHIME